jgi:hypothetical protein
MQSHNNSRTKKLGYKPLLWYNCYRYKISLAFVVDLEITVVSERK